jgi:hypothetical protein
MLAFLAALFTWACAPYTTALLVVLAFVLLQLVGFLPGHHEADADAGADLDGDGVPDVVAGHVDADHDAGADHDADGDGDAPGGLSLLGALGVGKVPLTIIWQTLFTIFGLSGIALTLAGAQVTGRWDGLLLLGTLPAATVVSLAVTAAVVRGVAKLVPSVSGRAATRRDLVGCTGVVISSKVSDDFGEVRLQDPQGRTLRLACYVRPGEELLAEGTEVVISEWDQEKDRLFVAAMEQLLAPGRAKVPVPVPGKTSGGKAR